MATFTVTNLNDSGPESLRAAITAANLSAGSDTIVFAAGLAGTISLIGGEMSITDDLIIDGDTTGDNKADIIISGNGSGRIFDISGAGTDVDLLSLTLTGGATFGSGGAIQITGGSLDIADTTIRNSFAGSNTTTGGGAIFASGAALTLTNSLLTENVSSGQDGGALFIQNGSATLINTTIHGNTAASSVSGNAGIGGGIAAEGAAVLTLVNSTVTNNSALSNGGTQGAGGGISKTGSVTLNLFNTVAADNSASLNANVSGTINTNTNNFIGTSPGLGALEDNGGTTLTRDIQTGSALINAGTNSPPGGLPATDANGNDRTVGTVDIGATEQQLTVTNTNDSGAGSLRQAIINANSSADFSLIMFDASLAGQTINVGALGELGLTSDIRIDGDTNGDNKADVTLSGGGVRRIFSVSGAGTDVRLDSLTLTEGFTSNAGAGGAVVASGAGSLVISDTTIENSTGGFGGGVATFNTALTIANSLITSNTGRYGGGMYSQNAAVTLQNTTVHANGAIVFGGGLHSFGGNLGLFNTTVTGNGADLYGGNTNFGGGIRVVGGNYSVLYNSVVADNFSGAAFVEQNVTGTLNFVGNSALGAGAALVTDGGDNLLNIASAGLGQLADNGGTVRTLAIETGSVLINAGSNTRIDSDKTDLDHDGNTTEQLPVDGRGGPRVIDSAVDIGAVEARAPLIVTTASDDAFGGGSLAAETADGGGLSLREALAFANADAVPDTITFAAGLAGQPLILASDELVITTTVTIDGDTNGDNKADITISGDNRFRIFNLETGSNADILSLTLTNGFVDASQGAGIYARSGTTLDIVDTTIRNCTIFAEFPGDQANGGGIASRGTLNVINSTITGNSGQDGGGVYVTGAATFINATISGNTAQDIQFTGGFGGGIAANGATLTILNSTIAGNNASAYGGGISLASATANVINSVVAANSAIVNADIDGLGLTAQNSFFGANVGINFDNGGNINNGGNPLLGNLLDNGGTVLTRSPLDGSLLIGAGGNTSIQDLFDLDGDGNRLESLPLDARGQPRIIGVRDIGAVEQIVDETIGGTAAGDTILGGLGNDILRGRGGDDTLNGGGGNDTADHSEATGTGVTVNLNLAAAQLISATEGSDTLIGIENIIGSSLNDTLTGNSSANIINGGLGNDTMAGGGGSDIYFDNLGDTVTEAVGAGSDTVNTIRNTYTLPANVERVNFIGSGNFVGTGSSVDNRFQGGAGDDRFVDILGGADIFSGNAGTDTVDFRNSAAAVTLNFITGVHTGAALGDSYSGIEKFLGSLTAADRMSAGGIGRVVYAGFGGDDRLNGGVKNDQLLGGDGNDILKGNADRDSLDGGTGNDTMTGGTQGDVFVFIDAAFGQDTITDYQDGIDSFKVLSAVADNISDFTIANNGTASVTLTLGANTITINGADPITISANDFVFF